MKFLFREIPGIIGKILKVVFRYGLLLLLVLSLNNAKQETFEDTLRFHKTLKDYNYPTYTPTNIDKYVEILEKEFGMDLQDMKGIKFVALRNNELWLACNFHENPNKYYLYGCYFDYNDTIYINQVVVESCGTELHELAHAAIARSGDGGLLNGILNSMHKHPIYEPIKDNPFQETKIHTLCRENGLPAY